LWYHVKGNKTMSRQLNPAVLMYKNMDIENLPKPDNKPSGGLLSKTPSSMKSGIDYKNPAVRIAKQLEVIRNRRKEINETE